jgi:hypothetical protein
MLRSGLRAVSSANGFGGALLFMVLLASCGGGGGYGGGGGGGEAAAVRAPSSSARPALFLLHATSIVLPGMPSSYSYRFYYSSTAALAPASTGVSGADNPTGDALTVGTLSAALQSQYPQYATAPALQVSAATQAQIGAILRDQLAVVQYTGSSPTAGTEVQIGPVLDACIPPRWRSSPSAELQRG